MEDEVLLTCCINLLQEVCTLLGQTVVATELWNDTSMAARDLVSYFCMQIEISGALLYVVFSANNLYVRHCNPDLGTNSLCRNILKTASCNLFVISFEVSRFRLNACKRYLMEWLMFYCITIR